MEAGVCRRQHVRPAPKYNIRPPGGTIVSEETVKLKAVNRWAKRPSSCSA